jgi:hypothetical protein
MNVPVRAVRGRTNQNVQAGANAAVPASAQIIRD